MSAAATAAGYLYASGRVGKRDDIVLDDIVLQAPPAPAETMKPPVQITYKRKRALEVPKKD